MKPEPSIVVHGGRPHWRFPVPCRLRGTHMLTLGWVDVDLRTGEWVRWISRRMKPQLVGFRQIRTWLRRNRGWTRRLASLPIDWSQPLYVRYGLWSGPSRTFLREDDEEPSLYAAGSQHERRGEVGVSVLRVSPQHDGWRPMRPSQSLALYRLPDDYLASFKGRRAFLVQGDRIPAGTVYDEALEEDVPVYATGADGEPLLEPDSIRLIAELPR